MQNAAFHIATGAVLMSSQDHLHSEAEMLPVGRELTMLCEQSLLRALRPDHPSNAVVSTDPGPRNIRSTLRSKFLPSIQSHLQDGATRRNPTGNHWRRSTGGLSRTRSSQPPQTGSSGTGPRR